MNTVMQFVVAIFMAAGPFSTELTPAPSFLAAEEMQPAAAVERAQEAVRLLRSDPKGAARKAREARDLLDENASPAVKSEFDVLLAFAEFKADSDGDTAEELERVLMKRLNDGLGETSLTTTSWLSLATFAAKEEDWRDLAKYGAQADRAIAILEPRNYDLRSLAISFEGIGKLLHALDVMTKRRTGTNLSSGDADQLIDAVTTFERGIGLFPPQPSMESFNSNLAVLIAWRNAAMAVLRTWDEGEARKYASSPDRVQIPWPPSGVPGGCGIQWKEHKDPKFPGKARRKGYVGSAIIVYSLSRDGEVSNARVLAEVPTDLFGPAVLKAMEEWRAEVPPNMPEPCLWDRVLTYEFYFR